MTDFAVQYPDICGPAGMYVHIPFCKGRCTYCAFVTNPHDPEREQRYIDRVIAEMELWLRSDQFGDLLREITFDTIYLGGGTPSVLGRQLIRRLLDACRSLFHFESAPEITLEVNPDTARLQDLRALREAGVNRVSLGAQSLNDRELHDMGRLHTSEQAFAALTDLRSAGFDNISVDLIAGYPGQTVDSIACSLDKLLDFAPEHLSVYLLELKTGTLLERLVNSGEVSQLDDDLAAEMYETICREAVSAGFTHYEISNFTTPGHECSHNLKYWQDKVFFGFGAGAHGMTGTCRTANVENLTQYGASVDSGRLPFNSPTRLSAFTRFKDALIMGLRLVEGVDLHELRKRYRADARSFVLSTLEDVADAGLFVLEGDRLRLTARGRLLSNVVFSRWI